MARKKNKKGSRSAAAVNPARGGGPSVGFVAGFHEDFPPLTSVEAPSGGDQTARMRSLEKGEGDDYSHQREGEGEVKLKALNPVLVVEAMEERGKSAALASLVDEKSSDATVLVTEAMEERGKASALASLVDEKSADAAVLVIEAMDERCKAAALASLVDEKSANAAVLAGVESVLSRTAIKEPFLAAPEENEVLNAILEKSHEDAEAMSVQQTDPRAEAVATLDAADVEKCRRLELRWPEMSAPSHHFQFQSQSQSQKEDWEGSFKEFKENFEKQKHAMEEKLDAKSAELQVLITSKAEMESSFESVKADLSAAMSWNEHLELQLEASKIELDAARSEVKKLRSEVSDVSKMKTMEAEVISRMKMKTMNDAALFALTAEKTNLQAELDGMKKKISLVEANKEAAMGMAQHKAAEVAKLRAELDSLRSSIDELRSLCSKHDADSSSLQDENDAVLKTLDEEKAKGVQLRLRIEELESYNGDKDREIAVLKAEMEGKKGAIDGLNGKVKHLQLAVVQAKQCRKGSVWTWLCPATTTVIAAASFAYATRRR